MQRIVFKVGYKPELAGKNVFGMHHDATLLGREKVKREDFYPRHHFLSDRFDALILEAIRCAWPSSELVDIDDTHMYIIPQTCLRREDRLTATDGLFFPRERHPVLRAGWSVWFMHIPSRSFSHMVYIWAWSGRLQNETGVCRSLHMLHSQTCFSSFAKHLHLVTGAVHSLTRARHPIFNLQAGRERTNKTASFMNPIIVMPP